MLPCLFLALTGNVLRIGTHFSVFGGSYKSLSEIKGREEKKEVKSGGQKVGAERKRCWPFVGISFLPS